MADIDRESVLRRRSDVRFRVVDDEGVVVRQSAAEVLVLNDVATRILALADGVEPVGAWLERLTAEYEVDRGALEQEVCAFAAELVESGLLELVERVERPTEVRHGL
ncbi:MAG TPA: PqqD family protein [Thermoanaerobaculia bacterium]|nr:PqqD family protein [Thermoanaerobaculia bacterium]